MMRALAVVLAVLAAAPASAEDATKTTTTHRVRKDDTLAILAAEFYGDHTKQIFIMVENGMVHPRALKPGETLRVPIAREIITKTNDTFTTLASTYLCGKDEREQRMASVRGEFIAKYNGMVASDSLPAGTVVQLPFAVRHQTQAIESPANISLAYFGSTSQADSIIKYNNLDANATLQKGEYVLVPVSSVRIRPDKLPQLDAESKARQTRRKDEAAKAATAIPVARQAWRAGDFKAVKSALAEIDADYLDTAAAVDVGMLLGAAHVAASDDNLAVAAFKRVLERKPGMKLRAFDHSPRVLAAWTKAEGQSE
jgi:LysM repeat protein